MDKIVLRRLAFTGPLKTTSEIDFDAGLNVVYGASNTGKSFSLKAIDFAFGAGRELPDVTQRRDFDKLWLAATLPKSGDATFMRALAGGAIALYPGNVIEPLTEGLNARKLSARHDGTGAIDNISKFLLDEIDLGSKSIATDVNGKQRGLSFRDLIRFCIVDETSIQSENSPAESGQYTTPTAERSVLKLLLTGTDDSAIVPLVDKKTFRAETRGKVEVIEEMITAIDEELAADYPEAGNLDAQAERLEASWNAAQAELDSAQLSVKALLADKRSTADKFLALQNRRDEIFLNLERFEQLSQVYNSDIKRLIAIEEAGFILSIHGQAPCPLCGASVEHQHAGHGQDEVKAAQVAAQAEIEKILRQQKDLSTTVTQLESELGQVAEQLGQLEGRLTEIEQELMDMAPLMNEGKRKFSELRPLRDVVKRGVFLLREREILERRRDALLKAKPSPKSEKPRLGVTTAVAHDFAQKVSEVLAEWQFPGNRHVSFDEKTYDLRIDGKSRADNGKGVRAITHAAFKVALLLYCRERNLAHPGFLILDTPLLTYRDPMTSRAGDLSPDERAIANTSLKDFFFDHLAANASRGQFIVVENVDPPSNILSRAKITTFEGEGGKGRTGLFKES